MTELLLTHAYFLATDPREQELMRPFPPLGIQYLVAYLRENGFPAVDWWDATFHPGPAAFGNRQPRPTIASAEFGVRNSEFGPEPSGAADVRFALSDVCMS